MVLVTLKYEDLRQLIKATIAETPVCPDGRGGMACPTCLASQITLDIALRVGMMQREHE